MNAGFPTAGNPNSYPTRSLWQWDSRGTVHDWTCQGRSWKRGREGLVSNLPGWVVSDETESCRFIWIELNCWNVRRRRRHGHVEGQGATNAFSPKSKHSLPLVVYIFFVIKFTFIYFYMTYNNTNDAHQKRKKQHKWSSHILDAPRITSSTLLFVFRENLLWILSLLIT